MKPKKWTDVYPHGTKDGDEELKFFISLARNPKYQWRSTSAIAKETGLERARVEEIINKYYKKGMVFQNPKNEDQWGYWERVPEMLPKLQKSISRKDQDERIGKLNKDCCKEDDCDSDTCCSKVDCTYTKDGRIFYIDVKASKADKFIERLKECFNKKKQEKMPDMSVEERWHPPTDDECGWVPIRPKVETGIITEEEYWQQQAEREWSLDL